MDDNDAANLDLEFKRYLQLLRPYLEKLVDKNVIKICDSWIQRLSDCKDSEKVLRNKYVFVLCYQLARGVLDMPFLNHPPTKLQPLSDELNSEESSTEVEYLVINNSEEPRTKVLFDSKRLSSDTDYFSQDYDNLTESTSSDQPMKKDQYSTPHNKNVFCYTCPELKSFPNHGEEYEFRANNLVKKLREIKMQNNLLQRELVALREESKGKPEDCTCDCLPKVDTATSAFIRGNESSVTLKSLKCQLQEVQDSRNSMIQTISDLHDQLANLNELKKNEIDEIEAKYKLELIKVRAITREEVKDLYEKKIDELKQNYEVSLNQVQETAANELKELTKLKDQTIADKIKLLEMKDIEISRLKCQAEDQKSHLHTMLNKLMERSNEDLSCESIKFKAQQLEKRLNKMEKSKAKCAKIYEAKLAQLVREKQLAECSLQLQLGKQRAQVINEMTDENQAEFSMSLDKLESKYKEIVANVQATAIQRRMQDQLALESIFQAACGIHNQNKMQYQMPHAKPVRNQNQSFESEISSIMRGNKVGSIIVGNKSFTEDSLGAGYCLNGERMGELFERVYIPQRDNGEAK